jgi:hypothetical protein
MTSVSNSHDPRAIFKSLPAIYDLTITMSQKLPEAAPTQEPDRRRDPRFSCGGMARILCLPSDGSYLPGKLRDLSLGGCGVLIASPLACGALAEILVRVKASSFRALGQIRAVRGPDDVGVKFLQMSAGGQEMLVELVRELARQRAIAKTVEAARRKPDPEFFARQRAAILTTGLLDEQEQEEVERQSQNRLPVSRQALIVDVDLDLFI